MILKEPELREAVKSVKSAFPRFTNWKHVNEIDDDHQGFAVWGEFVLDPNELMSRTFYVTFDTHEATWKGHLTIGQHCYLWSSADFGDAHLVDTKPCATLEDAITSLKQEIADLLGRIVA